MIIISSLGILRYSIYAQHPDPPCVETSRYEPARMTKEFRTTTEILEIFQIDEDFMANLFPSCELEKLHPAKVLVEDMAQHLHEAVKKSPEPR